MPATGAGLAIVKWATSFPRNPARGLPVVAGAVLVSDAETGALLAILDCAAVTSLRTGAAAAVSVRTLAREDARTVGLIGCGANGAWAGRCLAAIGYEAGVCADTRAENAAQVAAELGWTAGDRAEAAAQDIVVTVTPGEQPVILDADLRPGQHLSVLGADAHGKSEVELAALARMRIFCDEWSQASAGGELTAAVESGLIRRGDVVQLGHVLTGEAEGRRSAEEITLFDSTGLAIQDLAIARAAMDLVAVGRDRAGARRSLSTRGPDLRGLNSAGRLERNRPAGMEGVRGSGYPARSTHALNSTTKHESDFWEMGAGVAAASGSEPSPGSGSGGRSDRSTMGPHHSSRRGSRLPCGRRRSAG